MIQRTMRAKIVQFFRCCSNDLITAGELSKALGVQLSSLSSLVKKMCDEGSMERFPNHGPRGGYGYRLKEI